MTKRPSKEGRNLMIDELADSAHPGRGPRWGSLKQALQEQPDHVITSLHHSMLEEIERRKRAAQADKHR